MNDLQILEQREELIKTEFNKELRALDLLRSEHAENQAEMTELLVSLALGEVKESAVKSTRDKNTVIAQRLLTKPS